MDPSTREVRKFVFDHFFEHSTPPVLEEVMRKFSLTRTEAFAKLRDVEADHHILLVPGTQRILMANPYSAVTTPFVVRAGGRSYFANCAWDTVSMHVMLDQASEIESFCHHCAYPIKISMSGGKVKSSDPVEPLIFLSVPVANWYDNLVNTCSNNMVYFASANHMEEWISKNPSLKGESLTVEEMADVCRPLSRGRMDLEYARPPKEELMSYWDSLGRTSDFWNF